MSNHTFDEARAARPTADAEPVLLSGKRDADGAPIPYAVLLRTLTRSEIDLMERLLMETLQRGDAPPARLRMHERQMDAIYDEYDRRDAERERRKQAKLAREMARWRAEQGAGEGGRR